MIKHSLFAAPLLLITLSVVCQAQPLTRRFFVEFEQKTGSPNQNFSVTPDQRALSGSLSDFTQTKGFAGSDLPSDEKQVRLNSRELKTTTIESISWQWLIATHLLVGYELILTSKNTPLSSASYSWLPVEVLIAVAWFLKSYWNNNSSSFNPITQKELRQDRPLAAIITMPGFGNNQPQHPPSASSGQQAQETTVGPTGSFNSFLYSDSAGGNGGSQQHLHTLGLDCFVSPCQGVCQFRPVSDSSRPAVPMDIEAPLESDPCPICLVHFHGRDEALVVVKSQCCGHYFDLDCISKCFVEQPIGSRRCAMCRQDPMPMVNENTGESHPDQFFPDQAFYNACLEGDLDQVEKSLAEGVNVNTVINNNNGLTVLMLASIHGRKDLVERLINAGANLNARSKNGLTPLFIAAQENNTDCVKLLINAGADINARTKDGTTALLIAAEIGNTDCVKLLIEAGSDLPNRAFYRACFEGDLDQVEKSLAEGLDVNAAMVNDLTALILASIQGHKDVVEHLINAGANLNAQTKHGVTPLFTAAQKGHTDIVKLLIGARADLNAALSDGTTPLFIAAQENNTECLKILIQAGAVLNARTEDDGTPLFIAAQENSTDCVKILIEAKADVNARTKKGATPLFVAAEMGNNFIVKLLIRAKADLNAALSDGTTPLFIAAQENNIECLKILINAGADLNPWTEDGATPLLIAAQMGNTDCVQVLTEAGAR
ncbi:ankyrin repeat domain-containing protein [Endozoicomonas sp. ISHI1]|uniref:ankyrin repeat domain-containing protein n=1 Tax=Endozoicomonas sp. ISHI1 TaxID=2825882 RepID=UPI0021483F5F|nr:ankyrin repeat domain-containing protein [Endozoicomonas sp. ISHI1]